MIPGQLRKEFKLILGGKFYDKSYVKNLFQLADFLNISSNTKFINGLDKSELKDIYNKTDLFVFPSLIENCPNILLKLYLLVCRFYVRIKCQCQNLERMPSNILTPSMKLN